MRISKAPGQDAADGETREPACEATSLFARADTYCIARAVCVV